MLLEFVRIDQSLELTTGERYTTAKVLLPTGKLITLVFVNDEDVEDFMGAQQGLEKNASVEAEPKEQEVTPETLIDWHKLELPQDIKQTLQLCGVETPIKYGLLEEWVARISATPVGDLDEPLEVSPPVAGDLEVPGPPPTPLTTRRLRTALVVAPTSSDDADGANQL